MPVASPEPYRLPATTVATLTSTTIRLHSAAPVSDYSRQLAAIRPVELQINRGTFTGPGTETVSFPLVMVEQVGPDLLVSCACGAPVSAGLCEHAALVLLSLTQSRELRLFFDAPAREQYLRRVARDYGLEQAPDLDAHFRLGYEHPAPGLTVTPRQPDLFPVTAATTRELLGQLRPATRPPLPPVGPAAQRLLVLGRHRYYGHLTLTLAEAALTSTGKPKNPLAVIDALDEVWRLDDAPRVKFYSAVARFQLHYDEARRQEAVQALRAVLLNPDGLPTYCHRPDVNERLTAQSVVATPLRRVPVEVRLHVTPEGEYYAVTGQLRLQGEELDLRGLAVGFEFFVAHQGALYLVDDLHVWRVIDFFRQRNNTLLIHRSKFPEFEREVLGPLEHRLHISYDHRRPAPPALRRSAGFDAPPELLLYLSDAGLHVELLPAVRYGPQEVPLFSRRQLLATDERGRPFAVARDAALEARFTAALLRHYPGFEEQLSIDALYLPKAELLREEWFLPAFADWHALGVRILGFNELRGNSLNPYRAQVQVRVHRTTDWFETEVAVRFGPQQASLRALNKALRQRSRYVQLDDGTRGILPEQWLEKLSTYLAAGEIVAERVRTPRVGFAALAELHEPEAFTPAAQAELTRLRRAAASFAGIKKVAPPAGLRATLRPYQLQGLGWLHFLDAFNFGGCLADDMGLGKTLQVLALLLGQQEQQRGASLVVVPTSLVFNWQAEAARFAPGLRLLTLHGSQRPGPAAFEEADVVLTTYGTLLGDISWLRHYRFNYVVLDEAQNIKNPDSQRYRAARLLQARNRLALSGTPIENNTHDLYALLSFACPGLLGTRQHFREQFAVPIDQFGDQKKARALHRRIRPFLLRRTKAQVAAELPEKTEMVLYCAMGPEQRRLYEAYKQDFRAKLLGQHEDLLLKNHMHVLQGLTKLRQICDAPALLPDEADYNAPSAKLDALLEEISNHAPEHKILVFSQFVGMLELIRARLDAAQVPYAYLTGQTRDREAAVQRFQQDERVRVFLVSLKAGGVGLNLTAADYVYLVDPWWNPAVENQAIDRSHRLGQQRHVVAVRLICPDTLEERMLQLQESKRELARQLVKTDAAFVKTLSREELLDLLS
ncbi:DEAD/DEAH box helicase [Hymenobacter gummosus]|uniref:DEAD/DEAH box helicase n=1 Tax=Hymenobacter gummosus TaxID=1776032 RepID=A0A3S0H253_9BACT|nr:DEAD/DEAH box helicase [Hymenobacter gummosus]RTQ45256.1 DEAD/DEAH box helicase [Hymenobacter gummosus]